MAEERKPNAPHTWPEAFIKAYAKCGSIRKAAAAAKVDRTTVRAKRLSDPAFAEAMDAARQDASDELEEEARRRAVTGCLKPVWYQGEEVGKIREYSDSLLSLLLKANNPEKFREKMDVTSAGQPVKVIGFEIVAPVAPQPDEEAVNGE